MTKPMLNVSFVVVSYNTSHYLHECLTSIHRFMPVGSEVIVVDNASTDGSVAMVKNLFPKVKLIEWKTNLGFGAANNLGVAQASNPYVMLFNSDAVLKRDTATPLIKYLHANPDVSCVSPRVVLPYTCEIQPKAFGSLPSFKTVFMQSTGLNRLFPKRRFFAGVDGDYRWAREMQVGWVSGVCMVMRRDDYAETGGFDTRYFMYCEDIDLCMKLSTLGKVILLDDFDIIHHGGASSKTIAAKVRNSVWQQRHLLMLIQQHHGYVEAQASRLILTLGLGFRIVSALFKNPTKGLATNTLLQASWARIKDLYGFSTVQNGIN